MCGRVEELLAHAGKIRKEWRYGYRASAALSAGIRKVIVLVQIGPSEKARGSYDQAQPRKTIQLSAAVFPIRANAWALTKAPQSV
jgi:hypothetical protein